jgi:hypothetical protein
MKYVWMIVVVIVLVRIDSILTFIDKGFGRFNRPNEESVSSATSPAKEIVPLSTNLGQQTNPRLIFFSLLTNFKTNPDKNNHEKILEHLRNYPALFNDNLDSSLEASIYSWRDLLVQRNIETVDLLINLITILKVENQSMVQRFLTILFDTDIKTFLKAYNRTKDVGCTIATQIADNLPEIEKYNELIERSDNLDSYLAGEEVDTGTKQLAINCQTTLKVELEKLKTIYGAPGSTNLSSEESESESESMTPAMTAPILDQNLPINSPTGESAP